MAVAAVDFLAAYRRLMAQFRELGPMAGGRLALFCIHRVNRICGALVVTDKTICDAEK